MGGVAGIVSFRGEAPDPGLVHRMSARQRLRGADGEGSWAEGPAAFSHRQRHLLAGQRRQPIVTDQVVVMLDGWIYDHESVALAAGAEPHGQGDTHTLVAAWNKWGAAFPDQIDGEYAAVIWDRRAHSLTLVRDRLGVKPLFWARHGDRFAFASELPALLEVPWVSRRLDRERLAEYLSFQVVHAPRTLLKEVHQVESGCWLRADADGVRTRRHWSPRYAPRHTPRPDDAELIGVLETSVRHAVRRRAPRTTHTGILLSGGLGSAAIATAAKAEYLELPTFTVSFADDPFTELPFAGRVANLLDLEHHEVTVDSSRLIESFSQAVEVLGHPVGQPSVILQLALATGTREQVRVALSGEGGEQLFGGRMLDGVQRTLRAARAWQRLPRQLRAPLERLLQRAGHGARVTTPEDQWALALGLGGRELFTARDRRELLRDASMVRPEVRQAVLEPWYRDLNTDPINTALHGYLRSSLGDAALTRADRTGAAAGLDVRFPLLDAEVMSAAMALPGHAKLWRASGSIHTRWPLRALLSGVLPPALLNRPKRGLPTPLGGWLAKQGRGFLTERMQLLEEDPLQLWDTAQLHQLQQSVSRSNNAGLRLWTLFILDAWLRAFGVH